MSLPLPASLTNSAVAFAAESTVGPDCHLGTVRAPCPVVAAPSVWDYWGPHRPSRPASLQQWWVRSDRFRAPPPTKSHRLRKADQRTGTSSTARVRICQRRPGRAGGRGW